MTHLSIIGGSSPFTIGLFVALAELPCRALSKITLFGRDERSIHLVRRFAASRLPGVKVEATLDLDTACDGVEIFIHQIRYGGLAGRTEDESVALAANALPDETIGPAALNAARRMRVPLHETALRMHAGSPGAHVINLTNPLAIATTLMHRAGLRNPIGICELPVVTAADAAQLLNVPLARLDYAYSGFNHRGFLHDLKIDGQDAMPALLATDTKGQFGGLTNAELEQLGGLPTKYFQIFSRGIAVSPPGRATILESLRQKILEELEHRPQDVPPSLARRHQPWWEVAVVPLLRALTGEQSGTQILNLVGEDGLTREGPCSVSPSGATWLRQPKPPQPIRDWIAKFEREEAAHLALICAEDDASRQPYSTTLRGS